MPVAAGPLDWLLVVEISDFRDSRTKVIEQKGLETPTRVVAAGSKNEQSCDLGRTFPRAINYLMGEEMLNSVLVASAGRSLQLDRRLCCIPSEHSVCECRSPNANPSGLENTHILRRRLEIMMSDAPVESIFFRVPNPLAQTIPSGR